MTHEHTPAWEAHGGPEHDDSLPDAGDIPVAEDWDELDAVVHPDEWDDD